MILTTIASPAGVCFAQNDLPIDEIEVIKDFDARLVETQKVAITPRLPETDTSAINYQYRISVASPKITYLPPQIRPLALRPEEQPKGYRGFLRAGYGVPNAILGNISYFLVSRDPFQLAFSGHHHSANYKKNDLQKFSDSGGAITGNYNASPALSVSGGLGYHYSKVYFYGLKADDDTPYVDDRRSYKTFTAKASISNPKRLSGDINYRATLDFYHHQDDLSAKETGVDLLLQGEKWIAGKHVFAIDINADVSSLKDSEQKRSLDNFFVHPSFAYHKKIFSATGGLNLATHEEEITFFPTVNFSIQVSGNRLIAFAEIDGGLSKNNFRTLSTYNPFIHPRIDEIRNTSHRDYFGGLKGSIGKLEYQGKAGISTVKNLALFEPDRFDYRKFQPLYDDGNIIRIEGVVKSEPISHLQVGASMAKLFYDLDVQEKAWHLPSLQASLFSSYTSEDKKLRLRGELFIENGVPYLNEDEEADKLKGLLDISLGADYYFTENIGAFIQVNNLLGNKHQRWQRYAVYGLNGVAGVLVRI
ncbi:MAG TPA: hypothetical protein VI603_18505 [Saprospiraceae bacterium]|nr:hypothetical protein [Saprospiraceae bacterium]